MKPSSIFNAIIFRYFPYWPLFALCIFISCIIAWNYLRFITPVYEAVATVLIKDAGGQSSDSKMMQALNLSPFDKNVENEIEIIQSRTLMKEVINKLHLYAQTFEEGDVQSVSAYTISPVIVLAENPDNLKEQNKIYFTYDPQKETVSINNASYDLNKWVKTSYGNLMFQKNPEQKTTSEKPLYFNLTKPNTIANQLLSNLNVDPVNKNSSVIQLKFKDHIREKAEDILNGLCQAYYQQSINAKKGLASNTLAFVQDRINFVEGDLDSLEKVIQNYKSTNGITDLSSQGQFYLQNLGSDNKTIAETNLQLAILDQVEKYVISKNNKDGILPSTLGLNEPLLNQLLEKLYESDLLYIKMKKTTGENNPSVLQIKAEGDKMRSGILEIIKNLRTGLRTSVQKASFSKNQSSSQLSTIPQKEKDLLDFNRQQAIKNAVYTFLLQKREETALAQSSTVADNQIIDPAEASMIPNSPNKSVIYILAIGLGFMCAVGFVTIREVLSPKILFRTEIENFTTTPIVAELAKVDEKDFLILNSSKHLYVAEQFRQLRASIGLYGKIKGKRKILITSNISGEGKSFVSTNLALSLAMSGKKVLLVDMDLRKSKVSEVFGLQNEKGIIQYFEEVVEPYEIIKRTLQHNNLFIAPAGKFAKDVDELMKGETLDTLFKYFDETFDLIVIDTSPVDPVADAFVLAEYCDTTLFVVRHGYTSKTLVQLMDENYKIKAFNNLAIVFNGIKSRGFMKKGFGFGYGFGYENIYENRTYQKES
ncbi:MAG: GumC family protein [Ilyomonas sp.]